MRIVISDTKVFKSVIKASSSLVTEGVIEIDTTGLKFVGIDSANVGMVVWEQNAVCFTEYRVEAPVRIGVNFEKVSSIVDGIEDADVLIISTDGGDPDMLFMTVKGKRVRNYKLALLHVSEMKAVKVPELRFAGEVVVKTEDFVDSITESGGVSDSVILYSEGGVFHMLGKSEIDELNIDFDQDSATVKQKKDEVLRSKYSIAYLKKVSAASKVSATLTLKFGQDYPLRAEYVIQDKLVLAFIVAPRVEE